MKRLCRHLLCSVTLLALPLTLQAAEVSFDADTIVRFENRDLSGKDETLIPATQFLGVDVTGLGDGNLSAHLSGWGRADIRDKSYNSDRFDGNLTYGYLRYRFKSAGADIRAGRLFVREGIVNEHIDGLAVRTDLPLGFGLSAFGGATVHTRHLYGETSDGKGDALYGGRFSFRSGGVFELGVSGVYETAAPTLKNYTNGDHRLIGGDVWLSPHRTIEAIGHTSYNPETKRVAEHRYLLNFKPFSDLILSGEFNEHRERSYLYAWSMFSGAALNADDRSRSTGGRISYRMFKPLELTADYKHYSRERGNADRYGGEAKFLFLDNTVRGGIGYHYLRAGKAFAISTTPSGSYHEARGYLLHDTGKSYFAAVDVIGFFFKERIYNERSAWEATGSLGYHLTPRLALSGDVTYGRNPQFEEETRGLVRLTYAPVFNGKGGK